MSCFAGGWWCDEWCCQLCFCSYHYGGLADAQESAFAASIALQAYFEGRSITPEDMKQCLEYWRDNMCERMDPLRRKHPVCCEPFCIPTPTCGLCYKLAHPRRKIPHGVETATAETVEVYEAYERERLKQIERYETFTGPVQTSTLCRLCGCRRAFGRKGCCFCTEGCTNCDRKAGDPAPPLEVHDWDDDLDASSILIKVLGPPPRNVVIRRWRWDPDECANVLEETKQVG
jgi:hypothetical protein